MSLSIKDVEHVAKLARLDLGDSEKEKFTTQLGDILGYIEKLGEVDTLNVLPMMHSLDEGNVLRDDVLSTSMSHEQVIKNAPKSEDRFFVVKKVIE